MKGVLAKIRLHFFETVAIPGADRPIVIEKRDRFPLPLSFDEFLATNSVRCMKNLPQICLAESAEDELQLAVELRNRSRIVGAGRCRVLCLRATGCEQNAACGENGEQYDEYTLFQSN